MIKSIRSRDSVARIASQKFVQQVASLCPNAVHTSEMSDYNINEKSEVDQRVISLFEFSTICSVESFDTLAAW
jgi:hypothetical protein